MSSFVLLYSLMPAVAWRGLCRRQELIVQSSLWDGMVSLAIFISCSALTDLQVCDLWADLLTVSDFKSQTLPLLHSAKLHFLLHPSGLLELFLVSLKQAAHLTNVNMDGQDIFQFSCI